MITVVHLGGRPIKLTTRDWDDEVDIDKFCSIDYSNLYGEAVTIPALLNQVGLLKAEAERIHATAKFDFDVYEAELRQKLRRDAVSEAKKITEKGLDELVCIHAGFKQKKRAVIDANYDLSMTDSLFWSISAKNKKLDVLVRGITPEDMFNEIIEGTINNIVIRKSKSLTDIKK